ncbi:peptidase inhibitor family I36 protein [Streptomyces sp. LZ34]
MSRRLAALLATAVAGLMLMGGTGAADAATSDATQRQINSILAKQPDAVQSGKGSITWNDGVTLKVGASAAGREACPAASICLWEHDQYGGAMLLAVPENLCGQKLIFNLKDRGWNDRASSWANNTKYFAVAFNDYGAVDKLWDMFPGFYADGLPKEYNDKASALTCQ